MGGRVAILTVKRMESTEPPSTLIYFIIFCALLGASSFFSASESAFLASSRLHLRYLAEKGDRRAKRAGRLLSKKTRFLAAILVGNNVVNIALSALATSLALSLTGSSGIAIATTLTTLTILIFGEIVPKTIALSRPEKTALRLSGPLSVIIGALTPIAAILSAAAPAQKGHRVTEEDLRALIEVGEEDGLLASADGRIMRRILDSTDMSARDIMTARTDIIALPLDATRQEILDTSRESHFSRIPVYQDSLDNIRGIVHIKDLFLSPTGARASDLMKEAVFAISSLKIPSLQAILQKNSQNMAIVIDEFGGTAGLVTSEDVFEKIFGSIRDEHDDEEDGSSLSSPDLPECCFDVDASVHLADLSERLSIPLESTFYDTLAGFMMEQTGDIPQQGQRLLYQGWLFTVIEKTGNRLDTVRVEKEEGLV